MALAVAGPVALAVVLVVIMALNAVLLAVFDQWEQ
jgi:hypothetical protein